MVRPLREGDSSPDVKVPLQLHEGGSVEIDVAKEKRLVRKLDLHIIPVVMLLYLFSFLDR
jgi:hypothetical protein